MEKLLGLIYWICCWLLLQSGVSVGRYVDLTHPVWRDVTFQWPSSRPFSIETKVKDLAGFYYEASEFAQAEHSGTHLDAPVHFGKGQWRVGDIPLDRLIGPGVVVDIQAKARADPDSEVTVDDLQAWEEENGRIPEGAVVIMNSGYFRLYEAGDKRTYHGWPDSVQDESNTQDFHFPGFHPDAARWLVEQRKVIGLAVDTLSTDRGQSRDFETHVILAQANVWGLENVANLDQLPPRGFTVFCLVHNLREGSGGPARVMAFIASSGGAAAFQHLISTSSISLLALALALATKVAFLVLPGSMRLDCKTN